MAEFVIAVVEWSYFLAKTVCYVIDASIVLLEANSLKETGHLVDPGLPWKPLLVCNLVAALGP